MKMKTTYYNLWDVSKVALKGKFKALSAHLRKEELSKISNQSYNFREIRNKNKLNPK